MYKSIDFDLIDDMLEDIYEKASVHLAAGRTSLSIDLGDQPSSVVIGNLLYDSLNLEGLETSLVMDGKNVSIVIHLDYKQAV